MSQLLIKTSSLENQIPESKYSAKEIKVGSDFLEVHSSCEYFHIHLFDFYVTFSGGNKRLKHCPSKKFMIYLV